MDASDFLRLLGSPGTGLSALADAPQTVGLSALAYPSEHDSMVAAARAMEAGQRGNPMPSGPRMPSSLSELIPPELRDRLPSTETAANLVLGMAPGSGDYMAARDALESSAAVMSALKRGDYMGAGARGIDALTAALGVMPFLPYLASIKGVGGAIPYHLRPGVEPPTQHNPRGLPMDEASRMKRAREMGFTTEAYHGSNADIDAFSPSATGGGAWAGAYGDARPANHEAVYLASNPKHAEAFGDAVYPLRVRARGFEKTRVEPEMRQWARENGFPSAQKMIDDYYDGQVYTAWDADERFADIARGLAETNAPGATVDFGKLLSEGQQLGSVHLVRDPTAIRSRFATFDPERTGSSDLLASIAPWLAMLGGGAGLSALYLDGDEGGM